MKRLSRSIATIAGLTLIGSLGVAVPASAATCYDFDDETAPVVNSITVTPTSVDLKPGLTSLVTVAVHVTDPIAPADCDYNGSYTDLYSSGTWWVQTNIDLMTPQSGGYSTSDYEDGVLTSGTIYDGIWEARYYLTDSSSFGTWSVDVTAYDNGVNKLARPDSGTFTTTRPPAVVTPPVVTPPVVVAPKPTKATTYLTMNASPEPAEIGKKITAKAKLRTASGPLANKVVSFYFRAKGGSGWTYRAQDRTNERGIAVRKFTARKTGDWQARYAGTSTSLADRALDPVKVVN